MTIKKLINISIALISAISLIIITTLIIKLRGEFKGTINFSVYYIMFIFFLIITVIYINYKIKIKLLDPLEKLNEFTDNISTDKLYSYNLMECSVSKSKHTVKELVKFENKYYELLTNIQANEEELIAQSRNLNKSNKLIETLSYKLESVLKSFSDINKISKKDFLKKCFKTVFSLVDEAEKGTLFELKDGYYYPIVSKGYDKETMKKLIFKKGETFVDIKSPVTDNIEAYIKKIKKGSNKRLPEEIKKVLKNMGSLDDFVMLYAPIVVDNEIIGIISIDSEKDFSEESQSILKYYAQLISHFYNERSRQKKLTNTYLETVKALVSAIELKDNYTKGHGERVREYSMKIAREIGLSEKEIKGIDIAALLHDVGKIGVPEEILNKSGKLTYEEFELIKDHPTFSKTIVENISGLNEVSDIIYAHHEHFNGGGYPLGLKRDEIPYEAQIIQLADAYDAMTSDRSYRKALSERKAIEIIKKEKGKQFNPDIADIAITKVFNK
ncbi:MAG: HD-GYP domain-containing protein [Firmicutes bacterium]|nr:HD-GYP domain-containing protein [Bacillota bacterium]